MSVADSIVKKIKSQVITTRVRIKDFFADFDGLHSGRVTRNQFHRVLNICRFQLSPADIDAVCDSYAVPGVHDKVNYAQFCDDIESVFTVKGLEKSPTKSFVPDTSITGHTEFGLALSGDEQARLNVVLDGLSNMVKTRGIIVKSFFKDFDKRNSGFVTEAQFRREAQSLTQRGSKLTKEDVDLIVKKYGHNVGAVGGEGKPLVDINYRAFHNDVTVSEGKSGEAHSGSRPARADKPLSSSPLDTVLDSMTRQVVERRLRLKDFFKDFDTLRTGFITPANFSRALQFANLKAVTDSDVGLVVNAYTKENGKVSYLEFIAAVDPSNAVSHLERTPTASLQHHAVEVAKLPRRKAQQLSDADEKEIATILNPIRENIRQRRLALLEKFTDFDRQHEESVSTNQFDRVLSEFHLLPSRHSACELLHRKFSAVPSATGGIGSKYTGTFGPRIDYPLFLEAVSTHSRPADENITKGANLVPLPEEKSEEIPFSMSRVPLSDTSAADELLTIAKRKLIEKRIRIREYLTDNDKLRHGTITFSQFHRSLDIAGMGFTKEEVLVLASRYAHDTIRDSAGVPHVRWMNFADELDSVFVVKHLEKTPTEDVVSKISTSAKNLSLAPQKRLSDAELADVTRSIDDIKVVVGKRRIEITPAFADFDWHRRGYIPASQFKRALSSLRIADGLASSSIELICKSFEIPQVDHRSDINYKWFVKAIEGDAQFILANLPGKGEPFSDVIPSSKSDKPHSPNKKREVTAQELDVNVVLGRMREVLTTKNVRVNMFMEDFDKLRTGYMSSAKFRTALSAAGFMLTESEFQSLEKTFACDGASDRINWKALALDLDGGGDRLERHPTKPLSPSKTKRVDYGSDFNSVDKEHLSVILTKCRNHIRTTNSLPKPYFQARDFNHQGLVTQSQFRGVLDFLNLARMLKDSEVQLLIDAFKSHKAANTDKVDYVRFCSSIY